MFAFLNDQLAAAADPGADVVSPLGQVRQGHQAVALSNGLGQGLEPADVLSRLAAELVEELVLQFERLFLGTEGAGFVFLELFGDEVKWRWMAKIGLNSTADKQLEDFTITGLLADYWSQSNSGNSALLQWYEEFRQTVALPKPDRVLTKLMIDGVFPGLVIEPEHFQLIFSSSSNFVFVYKVLFMISITLSTKSVDLL